MQRDQIRAMWCDRCDVSQQGFLSVAFWPTAESPESLELQAPSVELETLVVHRQVLCVFNKAPGDLMPPHTSEPL